MKKFENYNKGYVINGTYFIFGFKEQMFTKPSDSLNKQITDIFDNVSDEFADDMMKKIEYMWSFGSFAPKYGVWIPSYLFQCPVKTKNAAIKISNRINEELEKIHKQYVPLVIAISGGDIELSDDEMMGGGSAYVQSGRFIDNLEECQEMIKNKQNIKIF